MDNEKFQELVLDHLAKLTQRFDGLDQKVDGTDRKLSGLEQRFDGLEKRFDGLELRFDGLEKRFDGLEQRFDGLEQKTSALDQKVADHGGILQAVRHGQEIQKAQIDQLSLTVARIEGCQDQMAGDISFLVRKAAEHDDHIRELRRAK